MRNYQARNFLRDGMRVGDGVLFYHSNAEPTGVVGLCDVVAEAYPDPTQFEPGHAHFDPKSERENPRWLMVDVRATRRLARVVTLAELKSNPRLKSMQVVQRGSRLSVTAVTEAEWSEVLRLAGSPPKGASKRA